MRMPKNEMAEQVPMALEFHPNFGRWSFTPDASSNSIEK